MVQYQLVNFANVKSGSKVEYVTNANHCSGISIQIILMVVRSVNVTEREFWVELVFVTPKVGSVYVNRLSYRGVVLNVQMVPMVYKKVAYLDVKVSTEMYMYKIVTMKHCKKYPEFYCLL